MGRRLARGVAALVCAGATAGMQAGGLQAAHVARLDVQSAQVAPGGQITVSGPPGWAPTPVTVTWNALDGPVLGTFPTTSGANASFGPGTVTVPSDAAPGTYLLFGNQEVPEGQTAVRGVPARARVVVVGPGGPSEPATAPSGTPPVPVSEDLDTSGGPSAPVLVLTGVAAFAVTVGSGLLLGLTARRRAEPPGPRAGQA